MLFSSLTISSVVVAEKFSASRFWDDIARWDCTLFQYIGELCRYLLAAPPHPLQRTHRLRLCCGNGLAGDVWQAFQDRFAVPRILEFYAATEGNFSLYNVEGKPATASRAVAASRARRSGASPAPARPASRATRTLRRARVNCYATSSSPATPGCAPAT